MWFCLVDWLTYFKAGSHLAMAGLERLLVLLPPSSKCWHHYYELCKTQLGAHKMAQSATETDSQ